MADLSLFLHLAGADRLDSDDRSFILYSKDPHYRLLPSKANPKKRRWQLVSEDTGLVAPAPSDPAAPESRFFGSEEGPRFEDIEEWRRLDKQNGGHSPIFVATMRDGSQYTIKWSDSAIYRPVDLYRDGLLVNTIINEDEALMPVGNALGVDASPELLSEYDEFFELAGAPRIPQGIIGTTAELADINPRLHDEILQAIKASRRMRDIHPEEDIEEAKDLTDLASRLAASPYIVSSVFVPVEERYIDWRYFGENQVEAAHNLEMLAHKHHALERLVGVPDRHPGNYLTYQISDVERYEDAKAGKTTFLPEGWKGPLTFNVGFDYDWGQPAYNEFTEGYTGIYPKAADLALTYGDDVPWEKTRQAAELTFAALATGDENDQSELFRKMEEFEQAIEELNEYGVTTPECEAIADVWDHMRDFRTVPRGDGPISIIDNMIHSIDPGSLDELTDVWRGVKEKRLTGGSS